MRSFLFFFLILFSLSLNAQVSTTLSFTENDGLIGNYVRDLLIDKEGLLWIATENGLSIYDGSQFKNFDQSNGLPTRKTGALAMDQDGGIFVGCSKGGLIKIKNDSITSCVDNQSDKNHSYRKLFYSDYYNTLFVGTENGIFILNNKKLTPILYNQDTTERSIILSICARDNLIFFTVLKGKSEGIYQLFYNQKSPEKSYAKRIYLKGRFYCNLIGNYLIAGEHNKLLKFNLSDLKKEPTKIVVEKDFFVWNIIPYKRNSLLIGGLGDGRFKGGLYEYHIENDQVEKVKIEQNNQTITSLLYQPDFELVWIGKENELVAYQNTISEYLESDFNEIIVDISYFNDLLYVLTESGVSYYSDGILIPLVNKDQITKKIKNEYTKQLKLQGDVYKKNFGFSFGFELTGLTKSNNQLFVQTSKGAISVPDLKTFLPFGFGSFILNKSEAYSAILYESLLYYQTLSNPIQYKNISEKNRNFRDIFEIIKANNEYYFGSSTQGLSLIYNSEEFTLNQLNSIMDNELIDIDKSADQKIWCISNDHLFKVTFNKKPIIESVIEINKLGLKGNSIKWIKEVDEFLYIATNEGIHKFNSNSVFKKNNERLFYNKWNGFPFIAAYHPETDNSGNLFVHTNHEIIWIKNNNLNTKKVVIDVFNVKISEKKIQFSELNNKNLSYDSKHISFQFRVVKLPSANNFIYRFKINDEEWVNGNMIDLQSLRAGKYNVYLEVYNIENNKTTQKNFHFQVLPPFWQTFWFWIIVIIILSTIIFLIFKWRLRRIQKRSEEKTMLRIQNSELQLRSLQIQMNPHFIFNALNSIQYLILSKNIKETLNYLGKLAGIIRTNLEFASENYIPVKEEIEFLNNYLQIESLRFKNKFQFSFVQEALDQNLYMPPMLVQPIIENSIKHGIQNCDYTGHIQIHFKLHESILTITITDNGIGRKAAQLMDSGTKKKHLGLSVIEKRINLLNDLHKTNQYTLQIIDLQDNDNKAGTQVILTIPVKY